MVRRHPTPRRHPSRLIALATVAVALAAAPKAQAENYWAGGNSDDWSLRNWLNSGGGNDYPSFDRSTSLVFGRLGSGAVAHDDNGIVNNDKEYDLAVGSLHFYNQTFTLRGKSLLFYGRSTIEVAASCPSVTMSTNLKMVFNSYTPFTAVTLSMDVARNSLLTVTGEIYGEGALYKGDYGTLVLAGFHNYTQGTNVAAGRLIDYNPHGNYYTNADLEFHTGQNLTYGGTVNGGGSFTKSGAGTLNMNGDTSWTGGTVVNEGRLILRSPASSSSYTVNANAALEFNLGDANFVRTIAGAGSFTKSGGGTLTLSEENYYTGGTTINGGRLIEKNPHGAYQNNASLVFDVTGNHESFGLMSGAGEFIKRGSGIMTLRGANTFTGTTYVEAGTLRDYSPHGAFNVSQEAELQFTGDITYNNVISGAGRFTKLDFGTVSLTNVHSYTGGTLVDGGRLIDYNPNGNYRNESQLEFRIAGNVDFRNSATGTPNTMTGQGHFTKSGAGSLNLFDSLGYFGSTTINEGSIVSYANDALPTSTALTVNANGTLTTYYRYQTVGSLAGSGRLNLLGGNFSVNGSANTTFSGSIIGGGSFTKDGSGTLTLTGTNTSIGETFVTGGRLIVTNPLGTYINNAALEFSSGTDFRYSSPLNGTGNFTKSGAGTLTLAGDNTYSGGTAVTEGRLIDQKPLGNYATSAALEFNVGTDQGYIGSISGAGSFTKSGGGMLTVPSAPGNTGGVRVSGGSLAVGNPGTLRGSLTVDTGANFVNASGGAFTVNGKGVIQGQVVTSGGSSTVFKGLASGPGNFNGAGTVDFQGGYSPGNSPASVTFQGDLKLSSSLTMELGGTTLGTGYDHLNVFGTANLRGALDVAYYNGFSAFLGQSFDLFDFNSLSGTFTSVSLPTLSNGLRWNTSGLYTNGRISVQAVPEPASLAVLGLGGLVLLRRRRK